MGPDRAPAPPLGSPLFPFPPFPSMAAALQLCRLPKRKEAFSRELGEKNESVFGWTRKELPVPQSKVNLGMPTHSHYFY